MYSMSASQTEGLWPASAHLPDVHSRWLNEASLLSRCSSQERQGQADMNHIAPAYPSYGNRQEQGLYGRDMHSRPFVSHESNIEYPGAARAPIRSYPQPVSNPPSSPSLSQESVSPLSQPRKHSQIAPALQIPRAVNGSQGSLSDLAAQITCLFWFESSAVLEYAANCPESPIPIPQSLCPESVPTPGFRKWVTTILSTTQVAQNVILLALLFIYRLKKQNPTVRGKPGSEYRLLTVALMLGNKFLDDNTYTNKTWAEVSGISVTEVHIMEVEFLSNMKYNLFTSAAEWSAWQTQLGHFARFLDRATMSPGMTAALPQQHVPFQTSPPVFAHPAPSQHRLSQVSNASQLSPISNISQPAQIRALPYDPVPASTTSRKRSFDDTELVSAAKRVMYSQPQYQQRVAAPHMYTQPPSTSSTPMLPIQQQQQATHSHVQLPPLSQQLRNSSNTPWHNNPSPLPGHYNSMAMALASARSSTVSQHQSPYLSSNNVSPTSAALLPLTPQHGNSPSIYLAQRDSPYKPMRGVHTLLVPPPSRAMHPVQPGTGHMQYQPLAKPFTEPQHGRLPYLQWQDGRQHQGGDEWWNRPWEARNH